MLQSVIFTDERNPRHDDNAVRNLHARDERARHYRYQERLRIELRWRAAIRHTNRYAVNNVGILIRRRPTEHTGIRVNHGSRGRGIQAECERTGRHV